VAVTNETRKLLKLLRLEQDEVYHVFCLALCLAQIDGRITDVEGEVLTRIGLGFGLGPNDIQIMGQNAMEAIRDTSPADVLAFSIATLKARMDQERLDHVRQLLRYVAESDAKKDGTEQEFLSVLDDLWGKSPSAS
jgi:hypothetical protein